MGVVSISLKPKSARDAVFEASVQALHQAKKLDVSVIHGDGTSTAAKKGGDNLGRNGHKHFKGDKVVPFCDRNCNVISPFVAAAGNANESPLFRDALPKAIALSRRVGFNLKGTIVSLDGAYDGKQNRKMIFKSWHGSEYPGKYSQSQEEQTRSQTYL